MALNQEAIAALNEYNNAVALKNQNQQQQITSAYYANAMGQAKQNIVEWELDFTSEYQDIIHLLRNDVVKVDARGNENWGKNPNKELVTMNDVGVNDVLLQIKLFLNKNKILANYSLDEINARVRIIKFELRDLVYKNYNIYGMDNDYKCNNYSININAIGDMIEDAYRRAMNGETHKGLNEQRILTQSEPLATPQGNQMTFNIGQSKNKKWYAPWSWGR